MNLNIVSLSFLLLQAAMALPMTLPEQQRPATRMVEEVENTCAQETNFLDGVNNALKAVACILRDYSS